MSCIVPTPNFMRPEFDIFKLHVELIVVDDIAATLLSALDPIVLNGFHIHRTASSAEFHVSVVVAAEAKQAAELASALSDKRLLVFLLILTDTEPSQINGSYLLCPPHSKILIPLLVALRRLFFEHSFIGIDFSDYAPTFRTPGRIWFIYRELSYGMSLADAGTELGGIIRAHKASISTILMVFATGEQFLDAAISETNQLYQIDVTVEAICQNPPVDDNTGIMFAGYSLEGLDIFSIGVFIA